MIYLTKEISTTSALGTLFFSNSKNVDFHLGCWQNRKCKCEYKSHRAASCTKAFHTSQRTRKTSERLALNSSKNLRFSADLLFLIIFSLYLSNFKLKMANRREIEGFSKSLKSSAQKFSGSLGRKECSGTTCSSVWFLFALAHWLKCERLPLINSG